jgi:hypothetical protein
MFNKSRSLPRSLAFQGIADKQRQQKAEKLHDHNARPGGQVG